MNNRNQWIQKEWIQKTVTAVIALGSMTQVGTAIASPPPMEKCYGVCKKGMNDCAGGGGKGANVHPCQGAATIDNDPTEWIFVPEGSCKKIVNGEVKKGS